jgi:hypothetical protein
MPAPFCYPNSFPTEAIVVNPSLDPEEVAQQVGAEGVNNLVTHAEHICAYEQQRIELTNQGAILGLLEEHRLLATEEQRLEELLQSSPPSGDLRRLRRRALFCWTVTLVLAASGFALTMLTLAPFRLGSKTWLYSIGVSLLAPFLVEQVLEQWPLLVKILTPLAAVAGVAGLMLFAVIRGDLLAQEIRQEEVPAVVIDDAEPQQEPQNDFYGSTVPALQLAMLLLAFSIEVGSGIALREARRSVPNLSEDWSALRRELRGLRQRKAGIMRLAVDLGNEPGIFAARFRRDFYRAMLSNAVRSAMTKLLMVGFGLLLLGAHSALAEDRLDLVVAIDLTQSVAVAGPDGKSEFQKTSMGCPGCWLRSQLIPVSPWLPLPTTALFSHIYCCPPAPRPTPAISESGSTLPGASWCARGDCGPHILILIFGIVIFSARSNWQARFSLSKAIRAGRISSSSPT